MQQTLLAESSLQLQSPGGKWPSGSQGEDCEMRLALVLVPPLPQGPQTTAARGCPEPLARCSFLGFPLLSHTALLFIPRALALLCPGGEPALWCDSACARGVDARPAGRT